MERNLKMSVGIGGPSIIMIFVILCLTTLSALSLMTANADWKLTKKAAAAVQRFYTADNLAEETLAETDATLQSGQALAETTFTFPVSDAQDLLLVLETHGSRYEVLSRKLVPAIQWDYDRYNPEFDGSIAE